MNNRNSIVPEDWSAMKKSPVSRTRWFAYFQILCYALERWIRTQHQRLFGKNSWAGSKSSSQYRTLDTIDGEPMEFEWNIFPGFTTPELCNKVQEFISKMSDKPEDFTRRIIFMSMFNDIPWGSKDNEQECELSAQLVSINAKRYSPGRWSFRGPGSEKKWYSTYDSRPQGEWDRVAELMMITFSESGHPVVRATSPLSRGTLKSRGGGLLSMLMGWTIETVFRTIISVKQLSIYGAVSDLCEEYKACHVRTVRPVLAGQSDPLFVPTSSLMNHLHLRPMILRKKIHCKSTKNEWKGSHNKIVWLRFVLMQDSWQRLESDSTSWQKTLKNSHNLQNQWRVARTLCHETKMHLNRKVGFEGTPKLGPCWKSQPVTCKVNMEWKLNLNL